MAKPSIGLKNIGKDFIEIYWVPRKEAELYDVEILVREDSSMVAKSLKVSNTCAPSFLLSSLNPDSSYSLQIKFKESKSPKWSNFSDVVVYRTAAIPVPSTKIRFVSDQPPASNLSNPSSSNSKHPIRPGQANCPYFIRTGKCAYGERCRYNHPSTNATAVPRAPNPPPQHAAASNVYNPAAPTNQPRHEDLPRYGTSTAAQKLPSNTATGANVLDSDLDWLGDAIISWKRTICKHYVQRSAPWASWIINMLAKKQHKKGKLPSNVSPKDYAKAVSDALGADPDLEISFDENGMLYFLPNLESSKIKLQIDELRGTMKRPKSGKKVKESADLNHSVDSKSAHKKPVGSDLVLEGAIPSVMPRTYRQASGLDEDDVSESGEPYSFSQPANHDDKQGWSSDSSYDGLDADEVDDIGSFSQIAPQIQGFQPQLDTLSQISHAYYQEDPVDENEGSELNGVEASSSSQQGGRANEHSAAIPRPTNLRSYFFTSPEMAAKAGGGRGVALADRAGAAQWPEAGFLGMLVPEMQDGHVPGEVGEIGLSDPYALNAGVQDDGSREVYLNTHEPFCLAAVGVQGGGKSHTLACVLEACLIPFDEHDVVRLRQPMSALVLHYDHNITAVCEATGLISPMPRLARIIAGEERQDGAAGVSSVPRCVPRNMMVVLVSPSYYRQRRAFYGDYCEVRPLLFRWASLTADHIKRIMRIKEGDGQLYIASMLDLLRQYQREGMTPAFPTFVAQVRELCNLKGQEGPLAQRLRLLESVVVEGSMNAALAAEGADLYSCVRPGKLVVADMTDPLLASEEANGIFQVLTEQYRAMPSTPLEEDGAASSGSCGGGKLLALDEAHKFMSGSASDGLSDAVVNVARLMRHDGMRLAVSTQSPGALAPELLELVTVAVLHRFHSRDWFDYLSKKLPLPDKARSRIMELPPGRALVFASQHAVRRAGSDRAEGAEASDAVQHVLELQVRPRITADRGASRLNSSKA